MYSFFYFIRSFILAGIIFSFYSCDPHKSGTSSQSPNRHIDNNRMEDSQVILESPEPVYEIAEQDVKQMRARTNSAVEQIAEINSENMAMPEQKNKPALKAFTEEIPISKESNTEGYDQLVENDYLSALENPLSTFSIDVDGASYSNARRYITNGSLPPVDAIRIEEFINYFDYSYQQPKDEHPFSIQMEMSSCPWNSEHKLVHVGLQGKKIPFQELDPLNLVFLLDVSGSMEENNKLPLLKKSFRMLVNKLRAQDRVAIVVYAGAAGLVLPSTPGNEKNTILNAIDKLNAGGSTAGGEGIKLAYQVANEYKNLKGQNRVILATDGDFNVGVSSDAEMTRLIEAKRKEGIYLTAIGVGMGNYKDSKMESMADNGNGNYFYIDNIEEAQKVLVTELDGTLYTIAKDVKLQIEFNPDKVKGYRLIGYENRMLKKEDFNNDQKDAGELGAGHAVTALYEIIPADSKEELPGKVDNLKYQPVRSLSKTVASKEVMTVKFRYKNPEDSVSKLLVRVMNDENTALSKTSENFRFSAAVASYAMVLRDSEYKGKTSFETILQLANAAKGIDEEGYRAEFIRLVKTTALLSEQVQSKR